MVWGGPRALGRRLVRSTWRRKRGNLGAAAANSQLLLFCDADDVVADRWVGAMVRALQTADVVGGPMDSLHLNNSEYAWRETPTDDLPGTLFMRSGTSGNMAVRRDVFDALGGFDTRFDGSTGEDLDFWWRAQLAGHSIAFAPNALAFVRFPSDLRALARQAIGYGEGIPLLYSIHRVNGMQRRPMRFTLRQFGWVILRLPTLLRDRASRTEWIWGTCNLVGRLRGAARYRVFSI